MTAPHAEGVWAAASIEAALRDAGLDREDIDYLNAHGTGTALNDSAERATMTKALGDRSSSIPVEATKSVVGHLLGAAGAVEAVAVSLALMQREIHPVPGECSADPALDLDLVHGTPRSVPGVRIGMSLSLGFGGANAALVLGRWDR
jgi:3-oxoacyl-[acyl-carrier-protein] synthase II